ncbi:PapB/FocB family fimbrial expression transcriptional regulator [Pseudomonas sp. RP23018S]|uniref:PapB/FocB family fimbrial expression transcriptional regulator n=1 Tax=Pseudomonas sp. RP23018S TaxID=3096037 RepID=UPI002ACA69B6|nr:PapB/FocB family fimbrial expression transcriptional regulator [Pseudomonas sp. RP23018S]MDZ5605278.1 PapB/FocB family fimbrial expression transcriptional regulator [Pseudomonas sp. RP23018S]
MSSKLEPGRLTDDELDHLVRLTNITSERILAALRAHLVRKIPQITASETFGVSRSLLNRKISDITKVHHMVSSLTPGVVDQIHFDGLLRLSRIDGETAVEALRAYLVKGTNEAAVCMTNDITTQQLEEWVRELEAIHYSVSSIAGFYRTRELGLGS